MAERVLLAVGTKKGVFVAESAKSRKRFELEWVGFKGGRFGRADS